MRNTQKRPKFTVASRVEETEKIIKMVEGKLAENLINRCKIDWSNSFTSCGGLTISCMYYRSEDQYKDFIINIRAEYSEVSVKVIESVCDIKQDYKREDFQRSYEVFRAEYPKNDGNNAYDKAVKKRKKEAVYHIITTIESYFGSNAEKFINNL